MIRFLGQALSMMGGRLWRALREIPYGETRSYAEIAEATGHADAVRAVGRANGDNRIAILVPCHRVIGKNGTLTGYGVYSPELHLDVPWTHRFWYALPAKATMYLRISVRGITSSTNPRLAQ